MTEKSRNRNSGSVVNGMAFSKQKFWGNFCVRGKSQKKLFAFDFPLQIFYPFDSFFEPICVLASLAKEKKNSSVFLYLVACSEPIAFGPLASSTR